MKLILPLRLACWLAILPGFGSQLNAEPVLSIYPSTSGRYGWFGLFDHRSGYGQGIFPEPFLVDDSDLEVNEIRLDWLRTVKGDSRFDSYRIEFEKSFGVVTLELELPYTISTVPGERREGFGNIGLGARTPVVQYVSPGSLLDVTLGLAAEWGIPIGSPVSRTGELVPKMFCDTRLGPVTLESVAGVSFVTGPQGSGGGSQALEYGCTLGYSLEHRQLPLPRVQRLIPLFELKGERQLNRADSGTNSLSGMLGVRANLEAIGRVQQRAGVGWVFPLNRAARDDFHAGLYTSLVLEF